MTHSQTLVLAGVLLAALILALGAGTVAAQSSATEEFNVTFGGADNDNATSVIETSDGGFALAGDTVSFGSGDNDAWLIKTDENGTEQFSKTFGGPGDNKVRSVVQTSDGGYALAGDTRSSSPGPIPDLPDAWLIKTDSDGNEQFTKTYGGVAPDGAVSVVQTSDGGFAIAGTTASFGSGGSDPWLIKTDASGNEQFNETFGGSGIDTGQDVVQTSDGGFALSGTFESSSGSRDPLLVKTDSSGNEQFSKTFGRSEDTIAFSLDQTSDGGFALSTGPPVPVPPGGGEAGLIKTDSSGNEQFSKTFGGADTERAGSVIQTSDGGFALGASTQSFGSGDFDAWFIRTDGNGDIEVNETFGGPEADRAASVVETSDGGFALSGLTESFGAGGKDAWLVKVSGEGGPVPTPPNFEVTIDSTNSPVEEGEVLSVTGTVENTGGQPDTQTIEATLSGAGSVTETVSLNASESRTETFSVPTNLIGPGTYTITVESENDTATTQVTVNPDNTAPIAAFTFSPSSPNTTETVTFDASGSSDPDGSIQTYEWDFDGDGTTDQTTPTPTVTHTYSNPGAFGAALTVTDDEGATNTTTRTVNVQTENLFSDPLPGFNAPPTNTGQLDPNLYEDISGDGDGLNPAQTVTLWTELVVNSDDFDDLTQEQIDALDWDGDGNLTPSDAVELWTQQVLNG